MPQLNKGETFADGQQVTGVRLNNLVDGATILPGVITDQVNLAANTVASGDSVLLHDLSAGALREATASDLLNSNLPITTSSVSGVSGSDITVNLSAGQKVDIAGNLETNDLNVVGNATIGGNMTVTGTANFTGVLQFNGSVGYMLTEIVEETVPAVTLTSVANAYIVLFTSASYTKPSNEIWHIEIEGVLRFDVVGYASYQIKRTTGAVALTGSTQVDHGGTGGTAKWAPLYLSANENTGTSFTSTYTFEMSFPLSGYTLGVGHTGIFSAVIPATKFRIYKYKTA